ncbi:MAG: hypothetical protein ACR2M5_08200 [Nakamurella sp.]
MSTESNGNVEGGFDQRRSNTAADSSCASTRPTDTLFEVVQLIAGLDTMATSERAAEHLLSPRWESGQLVLHVQPAVGGIWVPFETPNPTPCCAIHL